MPALAAECEAVFARELARERREEEKRRGVAGTLGLANVPLLGASKTTTEGSGPVVLGQPVPGRMPLNWPITPAARAGVGGGNVETPVSNNFWSTTNGGSHPSHLTNGSNGVLQQPPPPSRDGVTHEDSEMLDSQADAFEQPAGLPQQLAWSQQQQQQQQPSQGLPRSQKSAHTQLAHGSQLDQYHNSASTTTSGVKTHTTSDKSHRSSAPYSVGSNGVRGGGGDHPEFASMLPAPPMGGGSQIPDTQEGSSQSQPGSQLMHPPTKPMALSAVLNTTTAEAGVAEALPAEPVFIINQTTIEALHVSLTKASSGFSVEQLEQIMAGLMDVVWRLRGNWNRNVVAKEVEVVFNRVVEDIEACQDVLGPSPRV